MSKIILKMPNLVRLSKVAGCNYPIRLEIFNYNIYAVTSNESVAIIEYLGESQDFNDVVYIKINEKLDDFIKHNAYSDAEIVIETIPEIATASLKCDDFLETSCFIWPESELLNNWKEWIVPGVPESKGFMFWNVYQVQTLFEASPSGELVFPEHFDSSKPVLIRDVNDSRWIGFFIPKGKTKQFLFPAKKPDWWVK